jgi:hypothetical protein
MTLANISKCCCYSYQNKLLLILTSGNKEMIQLSILSKHFGHTLRILMSNPLSTWIHSMKRIINHHCAQVFVKLRKLFS